MTGAELLARPDPARLDGLLAELGEKNRVRVVKHEACKRPFQRRWLKRVLDEEGRSQLLNPAVVMLDELRILAGLAPRYLAEAVRLTGGELVAVVPNLRTTVGIDYVADSLGKSASRPAVADYMALTENAGAPAAGDTTLTGEITTNGLARAQATYAHTAAAASYTLVHAFTAAGTFAAVQKDGLFNAASVGTLFVESTFTAAALQSGDSLTVTHTINI